MASRPPKVAIYALTSVGAERARLLGRGLEGSRLFLPRRLAGRVAGAEAFDRLGEVLAANFRSFGGHVLFCAAGMVVRSLAPLMRGKDRDPAVVVVDQRGRFAISLLSGHLGGANQLAGRVAEILGGQAVITTATDVEGLPSLEMVSREAGCAVENLGALARVSTVLLEGGQVEVFDPGGWLWSRLEPWPGRFKRLDREPTPRPDGPPLVWVGWRFLAADPPPAWLVVRPPCLVAGVGCNRGTAVGELESLLRRVFDQAGLSLACLGRLASVAAKRDEAGLLALARRLGVETEFFEAEQINAVEVPNPSEAAQRHLGVRSVCEATARLAARGGPLLVEKQKSPNATVAVALASSGS